jgi:hypothetical protein
MAKVTFVLNSTDPADVQANADAFDALEYNKDPERGGLVVTDASEGDDKNELVITLKNPPAAAPAPSRGMKRTVAKTSKKV